MCQMVMPIVYPTWNGLVWLYMIMQWENCTLQLPSFRDKEIPLIKDFCLRFWMDKYIALVGRHSGCPYWETNTGFPYWGQTRCPYCGTFTLPLLVYKQVGFIGGIHVAVIGVQAGCPFWGTNELPLLRDIQVALIVGQHIAQIGDI